MDAYAMLGLAAVIGLLPGIFMVLLTGSRRLCPRAPWHKEDNKDTTTGDPLVSVTELYHSRMYLRWTITYTCLQVGFMVVCVSIAPMTAWSVGASRWRELADAFGAATGYLAFTPLGLCLLLLGIFPNDEGPIRCVTVLLSLIFSAGVAALAFSSTNPHIVARSTLAVQNALVCVVYAVSLLLLTPAWNNKLRCGRPRSGFLGSLVFPPALNSPGRLARIWLALRFACLGVGMVYLITVLLRTHAWGIIDKWSQIDASHAQYRTDLAVAISGLVHGVLFTPKMRQRLLRCLGRRARPAPSDRMAAQLSGFDDFYDVMQVTPQAV